jgi:capsular polysaccharide biosynthesis protein
MNQQAPNLRMSIRIVRRHKALTGIMTALGLLLGVAFALLSPAMLTSNALVVLPQSTANTQTQVVIASSDPVLSSALAGISPAISVETLRSRVQVKSLTSSILSVTATGSTATQAETVANAVAKSYIDYIGSGRLLQNVPARILESATTATGTKPLERLITDGIAGVVLGAVIGAIAALAINRKDRRLRERDEIANSIGVPVIASIPVDHPADAAGWAKLLQSYNPGDVDRWQLRNALQQLEIPGANLNNGSNDATLSLAVLSLSSDAGALALGPQLAVFAASMGIPTDLIIGPQQDVNGTASLRTACTVPLAAASKRSGRLRVAASDDTNVNGHPGAALVVVVGVVDSSNPQVHDTMRAATTLLGVSAGAATAEQLARAAMSAAADGRQLTGIFVADPEPTDRTTGRVPQLAQLARPARRKLPTRLNGVATEIKR